MKHSLRFFSLGLFVAAVLLFFYTLIFDKADSAMSTEDLIGSVEAEGYRVVPEEEYIAFTLQRDKEKEAVQISKQQEKPEEKKKESNTPKKEEKSTAKDNEKKKPENKVKKATFTTKEGVVSQDIGDMLVDNGIIKKNERTKFLNYLDDNGYSEKVQLGKFNVSSDMSFKELAEVITTYPGN
jgi:hypothetical protein